MRLPGWLATLILAAAPAAADRAGDFDYYLLALSWSPSWCAEAGDAREAAICDDGSGAGFTLHGLWPQHEAGWPEFCTTDVRDPTRRETAAMADLMGSAGLAWYQWQKHGRCSGEDPAAYFAMARLAVSLVTLPALEPGQVTAEAVEAAFLAANPGLAPEGVTVTCREGRVQEVRLCLDRDLAPRACGADVLGRACRPDRALALPAPR
jgi:ribonuclease T2